jgi:hypothetical protein
MDHLKTESAIARLLMHHAGNLLRVQEDVQATDVDMIRGLVNGSAGVRITIEVPKRGCGVAASIQLDVLDPHGGERTIRVLRLQEAEGG